MTQSHALTSLREHGTTPVTPSEPPAALGEDDLYLPSWLSSQHHQHAGCRFPWPPVRRASSKTELLENHSKGFTELHGAPEVLPGREFRYLPGNRTGKGHGQNPSGIDRPTCMDNKQHHTTILNMHC